MGVLAPNLVAYWRFNAPEVLGADLFDAGAGGFEVDTGSWVKQSSNQMVVSTDKAHGGSKSLKITYVNHGAGAVLLFNDAADLSADLVVGKKYRVTFWAAINTGSALVRVNRVGVNPSVTVTNTGALEENTIDFICDNATTNSIGLNSFSSGEIMYIDDITIQEICQIDYSGNSQDVAVDGATLVAAMFGTGYSFDKIDDSIIGLAGGTFDDIFAGGGTLAAWINATSDGEGGAGRIAEKTSGTTGWYFNLGNEAAGKTKIELLHKFSGVTGDWESTSTEVTVGVNTFVMITYDSDSTSNNPIIYVNMMPVALTESLTPVGTAIVDTAENLKIGNNYNSGNTFDGLIDEIMMFDRILSQAEGQMVMQGYLQGGM